MRKAQRISFIKLEAKVALGRHGRRCEDDIKMNPKYDLRMWSRLLGLGQSPKAGSREHGNKPSTATKRRASRAPFRFSASLLNGVATFSTRNPVHKSSSLAP
jgi:hypothetical protein